MGKDAITGIDDLQIRMASRSVLLDFASQDGEHEDLYSRTRRILVQISPFLNVFYRISMYPERSGHTIGVCHGTRLKQSGSPGPC